MNDKAVRLKWITLPVEKREEFLTAVKKQWPELGPFDDLRAKGSKPTLVTRPDAQMEPNGLASVSIYLRFLRCLSSSRQVWNGADVALLLPSPRANKP